MEPLWKAVWSSLTRLKVEPPYDPVFLPVDIYLKQTKTLIQKQACTPLLTAALLRVTEIRNQATCPSVAGEVRKLCVYARACGTLLSREKRALAICDSTDGPGGHDAKRIRRHTPCDPTYRWDPKAKRTCADTEDKAAFASGGWEERKARKIRGTRFQSQNK